LYFTTLGLGFTMVQKKIINNKETNL
jgi:hypothetical protein